MATYETIVSESPQSVESMQTFAPVVLQETEKGTVLMLGTRTDFISGIMPVSKGGTGLDNTLGGGKFIASNVDGSSLEEVDIQVQYLSGLKSNVQEKLDHIHTYTLTVTTNDWSSDNNGYYKEFSLEGIKSTDNPIIGLMVKSDTTTGIEEEKYAYSCIDKVDVSDDKVTIQCFDESPTKEIELSFTCV